VKSPATISMGELAKIAKDAARKAGKEARDAGISVASIRVPAQERHGLETAKKRLAKNRT